MAADDSSKNIGTRVFKKTSPNGHITTYLGKRDFIDYISSVDLIDGMILVEPEKVESGSKVFASLVAAFRYGREDLDVLGLTFRKDLVCFNMQVYPPVEKDQKPLTRLQERLKKKLGPNAYPFWFQIPPHSASSVTLQPAPNDTGKPCGVDYELKTYISDSVTEKPKKQGCVRLAIRKLTYVPGDTKKAQPNTEVSKEFMMCPGLLHMECSLDKEMYYHGESISVNVHIQNNTNKTVKKIKVTGFPVGAGGTLSKVFTLCPLLQNNRDKRGLALDGKIKHEDTNLASSTLAPDSVQKENLGIIVQYKVRIRLSVGGALAGELNAELPFTLTHPKPPDSPIPSSGSTTKSRAMNKAPPDALDTDLIQLDTNVEANGLEDDIIFEDFARLRLKGDSLENNIAPEKPEKPLPLHTASNKARGGSTGKK